MMRLKRSQVFGVWVSRYVVQKTNKKIHIKNGLEGREMAHRIKILASKPDGLSSIPETHIIERES